jgi:prolipoprotein diacylglyceryltransferase
VLLFCLRHHLFGNNQLKLYLLAYGVYRFLTETIRPEPAACAGRLTFYQWASVVMIVGLSVQWVIDRRPSPHREFGLPVAPKAP